MTMLDRMRRHKNWLKWSLAIVVLVCRALHPQLPGRSAPRRRRERVVADVDGSEITVAQFRRVYQQQMQAYRAAYGANVDDQLLKQLGIDQRIVQQLIEEEASLAEASRLGIKASDAEVPRADPALPAFQENGQFIGDERYRQMLQMQTPPMRPSSSRSRSAAASSSRSSRRRSPAGSRIADSDVDGEFKKRNERVKLAVVQLPRRQVPRGRRGDRRRGRRALRGAQGRLPHRREAQGPLRADRRAGASAAAPR